MSGGYKDRTAETTATTGTGTVTLAGALDGSYSRFQTTFAVGDRVYYAIFNTTDGWETGIGTLASTTTLSRDLVFASTNAGALVSFTVPSTVLCSAVASQIADMGHTVAFVNRVVRR